MLRSICRQKELEALFLNEATAAGFSGLGGHRAIGGVRASIYNALTLGAVEKLTGFMEDFRFKHHAKYYSPAPLLLRQQWSVTTGYTCAGSISGR
jgi:hypothetical protein